MTKKRKQWCEIYSIWKTTTKPGIITFKIIAKLFSETAPGAVRRWPFSKAMVINTLMEMGFKTGGDDSESDSESEDDYQARVATLIHFLK